MPEERAGRDGYENAFLGCATAKLLAAVLLAGYEHTNKVSKDCPLLSSF